MISSHVMDDNFTKIHFVHSATIIDQFVNNKSINEHCNNLGSIIAYVTINGHIYII